jgi:hypothetical protein
MPDERFPKGWDPRAEGYVAGRRMDDGRWWCLMPLIGNRLRIVIAEDQYTAGEHWCYDNALTALINYDNGPTHSPTGWSRHMLPTARSSVLYNPMVYTDAMNLEKLDYYRMARDEEDRRDQSNDRLFVMALRWTPDDIESEEGKRHLLRLMAGDEVSERHLAGSLDYLVEAIMFYDNASRPEPYPGRNDEAAADLRALASALMRARPNYTLATE